MSSPDLQFLGNSGFGAKKKTNSDLEPDAKKNSNYFFRKLMHKKNSDSFLRCPSNAGLLFYKGVQSLRID